VYFCAAQRHMPVSWRPIFPCTNVWWGATDALKRVPYPIIRPADAGAGRYRCPAYKLPDEKVKHHNRVREAGRGLFAKILHTPTTEESEYESSEKKYERCEAIE
jgi:hypothetical protein